MLERVNLEFKHVAKELGGLALVRLGHKQKLKMELMMIVMGKLMKNVNV